MRFVVILLSLIACANSFAKGSTKSKTTTENSTTVECGEEMATSIAYAIHLGLHKTPGQFVRIGTKGALGWWVSLSDERYQFTMKKDEANYTCVPSNLTVSKITD